MIKGETDTDLDPVLAEKSWRDAITVAERLGEHGWANRARGELGLVAFLQGNVGAAITQLGQALKVAESQITTYSRLQNAIDKVGGVRGPDLRDAVQRIKEKTPAGVLVGSLKLGAELQRLDMIDEYRLVFHPVLAGHGPRLFDGLAGGKPGVALTERQAGLVARHRGGPIPAADLAALIRAYAGSQ